MKYLMCNLKSHKNLEDILKYKNTLNKLNSRNKEFVLFPPSIYLPFFYNVDYKIGSQNISKYISGSHTGEILATQLASLKVSYVLINHCETLENSKDCVLKIQNALKSKIKVVLCIGRNITPEDDIIANLQTQITEIFAELSLSEKENIILAFEPCYVVNKQTTLPPKEILFVIENIKNYVLNKYNIKIPVIYGGGITLDNIDALLKFDIIDGFLLGSSGINPENLLKISVKF